VIQYNYIRFTDASLTFSASLCQHAWFSR